MNVIIVAVSAGVFLFLIGGLLLSLHFDTVAKGNSAANKTTFGSTTPPARFQK
jgi:hypothetical protein